MWHHREQEVKAPNTRLLAFLRRHECLEALLRYSCLPPAPATPDAAAAALRRSKYPQAACEARLPPCAVLVHTQIPEKVTNSNFDLAALQRQQGLAGRQRGACVTICHAQAIETAPLHTDTTSAPHCCLSPARG